MKYSETIHKVLLRLYGIFTKVLSFFLLINIPRIFQIHQQLGILWTTQSLGQCGHTGAKCGLPSMGQCVLVHRPHGLAHCGQQKPHRPIAGPMDSPHGRNIFRHCLTSTQLADILHFGASSQIIWKNILRQIHNTI